MKSLEVNKPITDDLGDRHSDENLPRYAGWLTRFDQAFAQRARGLV